MKRLLLAVGDTPSSLAATEVALALAERLSAEILAVNVQVDGIIRETLRAVTDHGLEQRRSTEAAAILRYVAQSASRRGVHLETQQQEGDIARCLLRTAHDWAADLIVLGRTASHSAGEPYLSPQTQHVLEFAACPVLIVPEARS